MTSRNGTAVLIAGLGSIGQRHLRNLAALGVRDIRLYRTGRGTLANPALADWPAYDELPAAWASRPDAVVISNPTALHLPTARDAAKAGVHMLIEKPIADSLQGTADLARAVAGRGLKVLTGFQFRFHPVLATVRQWLQAERIGRIVSAHAHWGEYLPAWHPWEDYRRSYAARADLGGGVLLTLCHPIDYLRWLLGEFISVQASLSRRSALGLEVEDAAQLTLRTAGGALVSVYLDFWQRPPRHGLEVIGETGTIVWNQDDHCAELRDGSHERVETAAPPPGFERNTMFINEMEHFLDCIRRDEMPACTLDDGIAALRIVVAAKRAAAEQLEVAIDELV